jgi:hypothetical protein
MTPASTAYRNAAQMVERMLAMWIRLRICRSEIEDDMTALYDQLIDAAQQAMHDERACKSRRDEK